MKYRCVLCEEIVDDVEITQHIEVYHYEMILENYEEVEEG